MSAELWFKLAAGLMLFFATAHTFGMIISQTSDIEEIERVQVAMKSATFPIMGVRRTLWQFYFGFGLFLSLFLLYLSVLIWQLQTLVLLHPQVVAFLSIPLIACLFGVLGLSSYYFFPAPVVISCIATLAMIIGRSQIPTARKQTKKSN